MSEGLSAENAGRVAPTVKALPVMAVNKSILRNDLLVATACGNAETIAAMVSKAIQTADGVVFMKGFLQDETLPFAARKHAAEALISTGTMDSVRDVLAAATKEFKSGKSDAGSAILSSLQIPVGLEGSKALLGVLLDQDGSESIFNSLPVEVRSAVQKTLRNAPDAEEIGAFMAQRYLEFQSSGKAESANELLCGVAHPAMLAELAAQAQVQGKAAEVSGLFDRLIALDDPGVVGAVSRLASKQPSLLNDASEVMLNWSIQHPQQAQPGLFAEYLTNRNLPAEQRVIAAYGLAGLVGKADARQVLEKSLSAEPDQNTRQYLQNALDNLQDDGGSASAKSSSPKSPDTTNN